MDTIAGLMREWWRERPDLDPWSLGIFGRIHRLSAHFLRGANQWLGEMGLTWETFSVIVTLRRAGAPFALRPTDLYRESLLSSGAMTNRIDKVQQMGLVKRAFGAKDRRSIMVKLTPAGRALADRAIARHFEAMAKSLGGVTAAERQALAALLGKMLSGFENASDPRAAVGAARGRLDAAAGDRARSSQRPRPRKLNTAPPTERRQRLDKAVPKGKRRGVMPPGKKPLPGKVDV